MNDYLSPEGVKIYKALFAHCKEKLKMMEVDSFELSMLANSFDMYAKAAKICHEKDGVVNKHDQVNAHYTVLKTEYQNILKHSAKFGLNPGDREKIFKGLKDNGKKGFNTK